MAGDETGSPAHPVHTARAQTTTQLLRILMKGVLDVRGRNDFPAKLAQILRIKGSTSIFTSADRDF